MVPDKDRPVCDIISRGSPVHGAPIVHTTTSLTSAHTIEYKPPDSIQLWSQSTTMCPEFELCLKSLSQSQITAGEVLFFGTIPWAGCSMDAAPPCVWHVKLHIVWQTSSSMLRSFSLPGLILNNCKLNFSHTNMTYFVVKMQNLLKWKEHKKETLISWNKFKSISRSRWFISPWPEMKYQTNCAELNSFKLAVEFPREINKRVLFPIGLIKQKMPTEQVSLR